MKICPVCQDQYETGQYCRKDGALLVEAVAGAATAGSVPPGATPSGAVAPTMRPAGGEKPSEDSLVGQVLAGRFRVIEQLGQGGMGTVYVAEHLYLQRRVALKLLRPEITTSEDAVARFQREALAASTIGHENIVHIEDCGHLPDGQVYLTMELLEGLPLNELLSQGPLPTVDVTEIAVQVCHALGAAHAKGIIHRDMKSDNVFVLEQERRVKILDFGIAKVGGPNAHTNLTQTGAVFGTPNYMSPEQALGRQVDHRADIYSVGVLLYEMLTGTVPYVADSFMGVLTQHVTESPEPPSERAPDREIHPEIERIVLRAMAKKPDDRFADMREMTEALVAVRGELSSKPSPSFLNVSRIAPPALVDPSGAHQLSRTPVTATAGELVEAAPLRASRSRAPLFAAGALAIALAGAAGVWSLMRAQDDPQQTAASKVQTEPAAQPTAVREEVATEPPAPRAPAADPEADKLELLVASVPPRALIFRGGKRVGETPEDVRVQRGKHVKLVLRKTGYRDKAVEVSPEHDDKLTVVLEREVSRKKSRHKRRVRRRVKRSSRTSHRRHTGHHSPPARRDDHDHDHGGATPSAEPLDPYGAD